LKTFQQLYFTPCVEAGWEEKGGEGKHFNFMVTYDCHVLLANEATFVRPLAPGISGEEAEIVRRIGHIDGSICVRSLTDLIEAE